MGILPFNYYRAKDQFAPGPSLFFGCVGELAPFLSCWTQADAASSMCFDALVGARPAGELS
jgi:hypothetical protein